MGIRSLISAAGGVVLLLALAAAASPATKPKTQTQAVELTLKASMTKTFKKELPGVEIGKVACVLPANGVVAHCTVHSTAPKNRENILFKVNATLKENGTISWSTTSHTCTDSKTGKPFKC